MITNWRSHRLSCPACFGEGIVTSETHKKKGVFTRLCSCQPRSVQDRLDAAQQERARQFLHSINIKDEEIVMRLAPLIHLEAANPLLKMLHAAAEASIKYAEALTVDPYLRSEEKEHALFNDWQAKSREGMTLFNKLFPAEKDNGQRT